MGKFFLLHVAKFCSNLCCDQFILQLKGIIKFFSKSTIGTVALRKEHNLAGNDKPGKALQKIGRTRFGTHWMASTSLDPCLGNVCNLVISRKIKFKVHLD
jgi:hypothetical protein